MSNELASLLQLLLFASISLGIIDCGFAHSLTTAQCCLKECTLISRRRGAVDAFGVLMWEMLTGQRPWAGLRHVQIITHKMRNGTQLKWPSDVHPDFKVCLVAYQPLHSLTQKLERDRLYIRFVWELPEASLGLARKSSDCAPF